MSLTKKEQTLQTGEGQPGSVMPPLTPGGLLQIPIPQPSVQSQAFQGSGPGEMIALLAGKIPPKDVPKALGLTEKRLENDENERKRQYNAFKLKIILQYGLATVLFGAILWLIIFLITVSEKELAKIVITGTLGIVAGWISGYGYAKSKRTQP
jgi:hypothetical protein